MKINCDLGEGLDSIDAQVMPLIDMANIACGGHAGDQQSMLATCLLAQQHQVDIGAHPSYPDRANFGRVSLTLPPEELLQSLHQQVQDLIDCAHSTGMHVGYIKPHGALYNDASRHQHIRLSLFRLAKDFKLPLMLQALPEQNENTALEAKNNNVGIIFEAFADRAYSDSGSLVPRTEAHSVYTTAAEVLRQAELLIDKKGVTTNTRKWLPLEANSLCVHSDSENAVAMIQALKHFLENRK